VHMRNLQKQGCGLDASLPQFSNTGLFLRWITTTHQPFLELNHVLYDLPQCHCWFSNLNHVHQVHRHNNHEKTCWRWIQWVNSCIWNCPSDP
jgi:hypothetical protein